RGPAARPRDRGRRPGADRLDVAPPAPPAGRVHACRTPDRHARTARHHLRLRGLQAEAGPGRRGPRRPSPHLAVVVSPRLVYHRSPKTITEGQGGTLVRSKWTWPLIAALALVVALGAASCGGGNDNNGSSGNTTSSSASDHSDVLAALVSDIGKFNDRSFNQSQLEGLNRAKSELGVQTDPKQSNQVSDYI